MKKYQNASLPEGAVLAASTPTLNEKTVPTAILRKHMAPRGKCGRLIVDKGNIQFVWEDTGEIFDADPGHPVVIFPERYHHVQTKGPAEFRIQFYSVPGICDYDPNAVRPGEYFVNRK